MSTFDNNSFPTTVIQTHGCTAEKALAHVSTCRAFVRPNSGYTEQIDLYAKTDCNVTEASRLWTKRKAEIARVNGIARRSPLAFIVNASPRISGWFRRKTKRPLDDDRHEKMRVAAGGL
jgi:hypothetical protein